MVSPSVCASRSQLPSRGSQKGYLRSIYGFQFGTIFVVSAVGGAGVFCGAPKGPAALAAAGLLFLLFLLEPVLAFVTAVGYLGGRLLEGKPRKGVLAAGILLALAPLIGFKYLGFLTKSVLSVLAHLGVQIAPPAFDFLLPMGISFYTLQAVGYLVDTYRGEKAEHNLLDFALFVGFFPQMVSGPISRGNRLLPQLSAAKRPAFDDLRDGVLLLIWGYFLKIVVADRAALFVAAVYAPESEYEGWFYIVATLLFCLQLYGDFGGCSVMAMGTAKILGIDRIDNFNAPYFSQSIAEFWRRWHISLSTWFRDYLYIPLGGNRKGTLRKYLNVLVTFAVSGLWHGAQWNYMAWGLLNGLYQVIGAALMPLRTAVVRALHIDPKSRPHKLLRVVVTFVLFSSTMVFFRAYRLMDAVRIFISMLTVHNFEIFTDGSIFACGIDAFNFALLGIYVLVIFAADVCKYKRIKVRSVIEKQHWLCQVAVVALGVLTVLLLGVYGPGFEASNFIYSQF